MKRLLLISTIGTFFVTTPCLSAQGNNNDTIITRELSEVVVAAPRVIRKADMNVFFPSKSAAENSKNGMQLLQNLMIPSLTINDVLGSISASGESVQVRINGRVATIDQVRTLLPETIKRVEWIDNPGLRYDNANYVLNIIVANPSAGGSLMVQARPALTERFGNYNADLKLNFGRSQWNFGGFYKMTDDIKAHRDYKETFVYADGHSLTRTESPLGGSVSDSRISGWLSYNYIKPDTTVFYVSLGVNRRFAGGERYSGLLSLSDGSKDILLDTDNGYQGTTPSFSAYLEQHFAHRQTLVVDFSASLYNGHSYSDYQERLPDATEYLTDINTYITDRNQAYAIEANYIKKWRMSQLTAGASYTANRDRSTYRNLDNAIYHQRQDKAYFFAEYFHRIKRFTFTAGIGAQYSDYLLLETDRGNNSWNMRPKATVSYTLNSNHRFRLGFTSWQTVPSLNETNAAPQQIDGFQWQIGNPNLKTSDSYRLDLRYSFSVPRVDGTFNISAFTSPNAISPFFRWEGDRLITSYENSRGKQILSFRLAPQIDIISGWLQASGEIAYRAERMRGTDYRLYNHNWSGNAQLMVMHWGFVLTGTYSKAERRLSGEEITWGEDFSLVDLSYNRKEWQFGAGMLMPFGKYDQGSKLLGRYNMNEKHMRVDLRIPYLRVAYNLQWGRQKRGMRKLVNSDASVSSTKAAGR